MPLEVSNILEVTWEQALLGQTVLNVQMVRVDAVNPDTRYADIAETAWGKWVTNVSPYQSNQLALLGVTVKNLSDGVGLGGWTDDPVTGAQTSDPLPPFCTFSFQQVRETGLTRHGHKLIAGVTEGQTTDGTTGWAPSSLDNIRNIFADEWELDVGGTPNRDFIVKPVIIGRTLNDAEEPYYEVDLSKVNNILDVRFRSLSTANSRKFNRGI